MPSFEDATFSSILLNCQAMKRIRVSAAIIHHDGHLYATQRGKGEFKGGWEFPGGKREEGESGEETIVREIREELGAEIAVEKELCTVEYQYPDFYLVMDCYLCHVKNGHLTLSEHSAAKWLRLEDIDSVDWLPADVLVVKEIKAHFASVL